MLLSDHPNRFTAKHRPLPFQADAVRETVNLEYAALFHEQGLGKTKMALDIALHWITTGIVDSALVVTKKSLIENWRREAAFHTNFRPVILAQDRRENFFSFNTPGRLYLAHYEVLHSERARLPLFAKARRLGVILDESQRIKNPESRAAVTLHKLAPLLTRRIILTGTPVSNRPYDLWSQIYFLDQGKSLGESFESFKSQLDLTKDLGIDDEATRSFETKLAAIFERIRHFAIRETKASAGVDLPTKSIKNTPAPMEPEQAALYHRYRGQLAAEVLQDGAYTVDDAEMVLKRLLRLVQVTSNPLLVDEAYDQTPGKLFVLDEILAHRDPTGPKTIVWTAFTENVDTIARRYSAMQPARVHGRRSIPERNIDLQRFTEDPYCRLLVATPGSAKEGLTLTVADHAVFFDRTFSLDDYLQAQDRIHRISQTNECLVENIISPDTIDEWVGELINAKRLAASLAQGDINLDEYRGQATYAFNQVIRNILDLNPEVLCNS